MYNITSNYAGLCSNARYRQSLFLDGLMYANKKSVPLEFVFNWGCICIKKGKHDESCKPKHTNFLSQFHINITIWILLLKTFILFGLQCEALDSMMVHIFLLEVTPKFCLPIGMWDTKEPRSIPNCGNRYIIRLWRSCYLVIFQHIVY